MPACPKCRCKQLDRYEDKRIPAKRIQFFCAKCGLHVSAPTDKEALVGLESKRKGKPG